MTSPKGHYQVVTLGFEAVSFESHNSRNYN